MHPVLLKLGPLTLYSYGLMLALGFLAALSLAQRRAARVGISPLAIQGVALTALLAGVVGARLTYVILNWELFRWDPLEILRLHHGGLVFYGGLAAGLLAGLGSIRQHHLPVWRGLDLLIPPLVLAHAIGRLGCFLNGCCYGRPSGLPWAVAFPPEEVTRHPTQLYESGALLLLFLILRKLERRSPAPGAVSLSYGLLYGTWRFLIEFLRGDNPVVGGGLTVFQWMSLAVIAGCGAGLLRLWSRTPKGS